MYQNCFWPGAYEFKQEISLFLKIIKEQIDEIMKKIDETDKAYQ